MQFNGGLKGQDEIIVDILKEHRNRSSHKQEREADESSLKEAKRILTTQETLLDRLRLIEIEIKGPRRKISNI